MNFAQIIKNAVFQIIYSLRLTEIFVAQVVQIDPLKIKVNDNFFLTECQIIKTKTLEKGFCLNDKIVLIRETGGQNYFAIDKVN